MKKWIPLLLAVVLLTGCGQTTPISDDSEIQKLQIVTTVFPAYDFARAAAGDWADVTLLLPPGVESHSYEPTPKDILAVQDCDLFVYLGGESDTWVEHILSAVEMSGTAMRMVDCVELLPEEILEGMDHDHDHDGHADHDHEEHSDLGIVTGMDEHVWTDPENASAITRMIGDKLAELDAENAEHYRANAAAYAEEIDSLDEVFESFFDGLKCRTIVFGDRFPLRYFAEAYDLEYYAAFPGCGRQTEPSAATVAFLTEKVHHEALQAVWYIEFSNHLVADGIAEAAGVETAMFHTCHNVSRADIENGETYVTLMKRNLETLRQYMA